MLRYIVSILPTCHRGSIIYNQAYFSPANSSSSECFATTADLFGKLFDTQMYDGSDSSSTQIPFPSDPLSHDCDFCRLLGRKLLAKQAGILTIERVPNLIRHQSGAGIGLQRFGLSLNRWERPQCWFRVMAPMCSEAFTNGDVAGTLLADSEISTNDIVAEAFLSNRRSLESSTNDFLESFTSNSLDTRSKIRKYSERERLFLPETNRLKYFDISLAFNTPLEVSTSNNLAEPFCAGSEFLESSTNDLTTEESLLYSPNGSVESFISDAKLLGSLSYNEAVEHFPSESLESLAENDITGTFLANSGSLKSLDLVRFWYRGCRQHHGECKRTLEGQTLNDDLNLPTRIIDVRNADSGYVRLVDTHGSLEKWAALSHCWGDRRPTCTTHSNLQIHREGILLQGLPRTFRDAVAVTQSLGLGYLWIDTLCILQEDPEDWEREAPKMGQVYEHAEIVITAAGSGNAYEGCFVYFNSQPEVKIPYIKDGVIAGQLIAQRESISACGGDTFHPLSKRAWTIQERVLARRTIYYTKKGIWWNCRHHGTTCIRHDGTSFEDVQLTPRHQVWTGLLAQYLNCALSVSTDNLPAIEGIATRIASRRSDQYYHGCWTDDLPWQLVWYGNSPRLPELSDHPSWSWSSTAMSRRVFLDERTWKTMTNLCGPFKPCPPNSLRVRCPIHSPVRLERDKSKYRWFSFKDPLNSLTGVSIDELIGSDLLGDSIPNDLLYLILNSKKQKVGIAVMDDASWLSQKTNSSTNLHLVFLTATHNPKSKSWLVRSDQRNVYYGLLTQRRSDEEKSYNRVGFAFIHSQAYIEQAIKQDAILI
ncbi:heterokaryon incompatibility protein-domain-containing protein [Hypoxylon sp. FL1284]|nr:heterokaryon incompatibility protein-domain-containing protein [Hypoxylon sp. FL1284]